MIYLKADLELKQRALDRTVPTDGQPGRYRPPDDIIDFSTVSDYPGRITETGLAPGRDRRPSG